MKSILMSVAVIALAAPAMAAGVGASTNAATNVTTGVNTSQDSGVSLLGKAKVMPHATVNTGDNASSTDVRTSADTSARTTASDDDTTTNTNHSYNHDNGKGKKYGHYHNHHRNDIAPAAGGNVRAGTTNDASVGH